VDQNTINNHNRNININRNLNPQFFLFVALPVWDFGSPEIFAQDMFET